MGLKDFPQNLLLSVEKTGLGMGLRRDEVHSAAVPWAGTIRSIPLSIYGLRAACGGPAPKCACGREAPPEKVTLASPARLPLSFRVVNALPTAPLR